MKTQKTQFENRARLSVSDEVWQKVTAKFLLDKEGYTSLTVNKRLKTAVNSRENGKLGGRPPKDKNPENPELKPKEKEKEKENIYTYGSGTTSVAIRKKYANEDAKRIFDLRLFFESEGQLSDLEVKGWRHYQAFIDANAGRVFNDADHLYNAYRAFSLEYKPTEASKKFDEAEYNKSLWVLPEWEKFYSWRLKNEPDFAKHFGYDGKLQESKSVGSRNNGRGGLKGASSAEG